MICFYFIQGYIWRYISISNILSCLLPLQIYLHNRSHKLASYNINTSMMLFCSSILHYSRLIGIVIQFQQVIVVIVCQDLIVHCIQMYLISFQQAPVQGTGPVQGVKFLSVCLIYANMVHNLEGIGYVEFEHLH